MSDAAADHADSRIAAFTTSGSCKQNASERGRGERIMMELGGRGRTRTYHGPAGTLERDDEGRGAAGLVALIAEPEIGVVLWD